MIKIIEKIKDYISGKYFDFITDREFNGKDPNYFGEVSDKIAEEVHDFLSDLIAEAFIDEIGLIEENDDCIIQVYVNTDDPETIPHFHIRKYGDGDEAEWETCVKYTDAVYCRHNNLNDKLPDKEIAVALDKMLRSPNPYDPGRTYWQTATVAWNCNNDKSGIELPFDLIQPDYTQLK
ncbi:MAG: hypothetical protein J5562_03210 [Clostridia bacterium]|nr:hypothetical protein [Clostridia bacterium]